MAFQEHQETRYCVPDVSPDPLEILDFPARFQFS
jgi:hypothetical protein